MFILKKWYDETSYGWNWFQMKPLHGRNGHDITILEGKEVLGDGYEEILHLVGWESSYIPISVDRLPLPASNTIYIVWDMEIKGIKDIQVQSKPTEYLQ